MESEEEALAYCRSNPVGVVLLRSSAGVDVYTLCQHVREQVAQLAAAQNSPRRVAVILLLERGAAYDSAAAHAAGADGMLDMPIAVNQAFLVLKKFIPMGR